MSSPIHLAFYQPEIPQNTGTLIRMSACLGIVLDIIHPCGFLMTDRYLKRSGLDYHDLAAVVEHKSWDDFLVAYKGRRLLLATPEGAISHTEHKFSEQDIIVLGQESCGFPQGVLDFVPDHIAIPMVPGCRSLNVALSGALLVGEALGQLNAFPKGSIRSV